MALPAVKHMDPVVGIDVHSVIVTPGLPPVFLPHPHIGFMLDLQEYIAAAKGVIGSIAMTIAEDAVLDYLKDHPDDRKKLTDALNSLKDQKKQATSDPWVAKALKLNREVSSIKGDMAGAIGAGVGAGATAGRPIFVNGLMRATAGTHSFHVPGLHFPLGETFAPPDPLPSDDAESYMGSRTVLANNDPLSYMALSAMSCWAEGIEPPPHNGAHTTRTHVSMPSSVMLPIPAGRPVLVGGPPVMNMAAAAKGMFKAFQGSKWAKKLADKLHLKSGFLRCTVLKAEPVDVTTGEVVVQQNDFTVSGRLPLVWDRYYASHDRHAGAVGFGWQTPADIRLELMRNEDGIGAAACFPDHATAFDMVPADDGWPARTYDWQHGHALYGDDGRMVLRTREGIEYGFALPSRWRDAVAALDGDDSRLALPIDRMADLNGNAWVFERDVYGGLVRLVEWKRDGRTERVVECGTGSGLHAGLLTSLTLIDAGGNAHPLVSYEHDRERNLAAAIDAMAHPHHFEYAAGHRMVSHTSARGVSFYYSYQQGDDGVWRVDHAWGDNGLFDYRFVYDRARMETRVTNSLGHTTITQMNERGMPVAEIDPLGGVTGYRYDAQGRASAMIDPAGRTTAWEYDAHGSLIAQTLPDGSAVRTEFDLDHRPVCMTLIGGRQWRYEWDTFGNLLAQIDPSGAISRYTYDEYGQLVEHTGPRSASTRFDYHRDGNLAAQIDALGHRTQYRYDARGYLIEAIDALGQQSKYEYDRNGNLTRAIEPGGREIHCVYDADGNLSRHRDPMGHVTQMDYSVLGQVSRRLAPDGTTVEYRYDTEEQLIGVVNERGERYALERDALGRIVVETDYWGQARRYRYGAAGELLYSTDPLGQTVEYRYDRLGRIVQKCVPHPEQDDGLQIDSFAYDRHGDLVLAQNPSCRVEFSHDAAGRVIEERQGDHFTIASDYDEAGNRIERRTRLNAGGAVVAHTVRYTYDALDAVTSIQIDDTAPVVLGRDALGQICTEQLGAELRRELSYESGGQLASQRTLLTGIGELFASEYTYDANGELVEKRDSRGGIERFQYDPVGRVIAHLDPAGRLRRYLYDPAGDLLKTHIRERRTADAAAAAKTGAWVREGEYEGCYYAYDRVGNLIRKQDAAQDLTLRWDAAGQLVETVAVRPGFAASRETPAHIRARYEYDPFQRRVRKVVCEGATGGAVQQPLSRLSRFFWDGDTLVGEYAAGGEGGGASAPEVDGDLGAPSFAVSEHDQTDTGTLPVASRMYEWIFYPKSFRPLAIVQDDLAEWRVSARLPGQRAPGTGSVYFYQSDLNGAPVRMHDASGRAVWEARYYPRGAVECTERWSVQPLRLQGQYHDDESGLHYNRYRYFDPDTGSFISHDPIGLEGGLNPYQFAPNIFGWADPVGLKCTHHAKNPKEAHAAIKDKWGHEMTPAEMRELQRTIDNIKSNRQTYPRDGIPFDNDFRKSPDGQRLDTGSGPYSEWTVRTPGVGNRGERRIVVDKSTGRAYYSHDHYQSFIEIDLGGWK
ncbi:RHS repeat-associated core domain-containing protein [Burkholderia oklahomensis]|uniref:RHS repeat-associated core domain-containing protein n=1 Tax=Burkholderia oklahomensis TaxID=342113 RepID=UPI00016A8377|nr:RHS repeat-associated core domain-containing protein [Burkholderia oklahomensis]AJX36156.1 RHS repeat-associated core domain protein [Burkholderia oklahomensis C6786]AOI48077.1 type IV secretion protein Rhs [Burkholderia oklahomensis C6786]KUY50054.1 type IV secretion protein Rhs [Burkholderia oklahomensis C6786]MBI0363802.1 RHS domain-containing protein [Burkholderia oklahomensis]SUY27928.1 Cell wall-associated polypeptide CWBP200 [Burkholderia oklahomensis]